MAIISKIPTDDSFLPQVYEIDKIIYKKEGLCGEYPNLVARYNACKDSFVLVYDDAKLIGYINFFPVTDDLHQNMTNQNENRFWDDDINDTHIKAWSQKNNIFIISVVVLKEYQNTDAIIHLSNTFLDFLRDKSSKGFKISSVSGFAVSTSGVRLLKRCRCKLLKGVENNKYHYFYANGHQCDKLLDDGFAIKSRDKSYKNDIYFFIPFTAEISKSHNADSIYNALIKNSIENPQAQSEFSNESPTEDLSKLHFGDLYRICLNRHVDYECNKDHFKDNEIDRIYLGEFELGCFDDDYDDINLHKGLMVHLFVTAHRETDIYLVTLAVINNQYDASQLIDQMSTDNLKIFNKGELVSVTDYFGANYSLEPCGESKCVICLDKMPDTPSELPYILSGEANNSQHINYRIKDELQQDLLKPRAVYNYYDSYISKSVIALIFKSFSDDIAARISNEASELFIAEIVLFQNTAVLRTNKKVTEMLRNAESFDENHIKDLYIEFGKTVHFWNTDIFKYPFSQREADAVIESFGIEKTLEEYRTNHKLLDRLIELQNSMEAQKADKKMNNILFFLSFIEAGSVVLAVAL